MPQFIRTRSSLHLITKATSLALATGSAASHAAVLDLDNEVAQRMLQGQRIATAFQRATGLTLPHGTPVSMKFAGAATGSIRYQPNAAASSAPTPVVIDASTAINCNEEAQEDTLNLSKQFGNRFSLSNTDTVQTSVGVDVSVDAPFASGSAKFDRTWSSSTTNEQSKSDDTIWSKSSTLHIRPGKKLSAQLVVSVQKLAGTYRIPLVLSGTVNASTLAPLPNGYGFTWVTSGGSAPSALNVNADRPGNEYQAICVGYSSVAGVQPLVGNMWEGRCHVNQSTETLRKLGPAASTAYQGNTLPGPRLMFHRFNVVTGQPEHAVWMSPAEVATSGAKPHVLEPALRDVVVCLADYNNTRIPGTVQNNQCLFTTDRVDRSSPSYKILMPAAAKTNFTFRLEEFVPNPDDRTVEVRGTFTGALGTQSEIRTSPAVDIRPNECAPVNESATLSAGTWRGPVLTGAAPPPHFGRKQPGLRFVSEPVTPTTRPF